MTPTVYAACIHVDTPRENTVFCMQKYKPHSKYVLHVQVQCMYIHFICTLYVCNHVFNLLLIVKGPQNVTAYQGQIAVFTCETVGGDWKVNGTGFTGLSHEVQQDLRTSRESQERATLTILARATYNGTTVQCVTGQFGGNVVESENATLTIQGTCTCISELLYGACNVHMTKLHA